MSGRPSLIPRQWFRPIGQLVELYERFGSIPRAVTGLISLYIINTVFGLASYVVSSILSVFDLAAASLQIVRVRLGLQGQLVGFRLFNIIGTIQRELSLVIADLGPLGPPVAIGTLTILLFVWYRFLIALLGEFPIGSSIVDLLGLR